MIFIFARKHLVPSTLLPGHLEPVWRIAGKVRAKDTKDALDKAQRATLAPMENLCVAGISDTI